MKYLAIILMFILGISCQTASNDEEKTQASKSVKEKTAITNLPPFVLAERQENDQGVSYVLYSARMDTKDNIPFILGLKFSEEHVKIKAVNTLITNFRTGIEEETYIKSLLALYKMHNQNRFNRMGFMTSNIFISRSDAIDLGVDFSESGFIMVMKDQMFNNLVYN